MGKFIGECLDKKKKRKKPESSKTFSYESVYYTNIKREQELHSFAITGKSEEATDETETKSIFVDASRQIKKLFFFISLAHSKTLLNEIERRKDLRRSFESHEDLFLFFYLSLHVPLHIHLAVSSVPLTRTLTISI